MDENERKRLEYEEQFFGISSKFFTDSFKNFIKDELDLKVAMFVDDFGKKIKSQAKNPEHFQAALEEMKWSLTQDYQKSLDSVFPEMESTISSILNIPDNVLLQEDLPIKNCINGNLDEIKEEVENLEGTYKSLLCLKQEMLEELNEAESAIFYLENVINGNKINFEVMDADQIISLSEVNTFLFNKKPKCN